MSNVPPVPAGTIALLTIHVSGYPTRVETPGLVTPSGNAVRNAVVVVGRYCTFKLHAAAALGRPGQSVLVERVYARVSLSANTPRLTTAGSTGTRVSTT